MTPKTAIEFMNEMSRYFERKAVDTKEDATFQSAQNNARCCREIAMLIEELAK